MRYFIDTEFIESGPYKPIQLISIGIVSEDGRNMPWHLREIGTSTAKCGTVEFSLPRTEDIKMRPTDGKVCKKCAELMG